MTQRAQTLDIAKGIAIIAIVFGHVWRGLGTVTVLDVSSAEYRLVDASVYMFHLSVFAFAAGLFVPHGMRRDGPWLYTRSRDLGFLWLYVLWTLITGASKISLSSIVNTPVSWATVLQIWKPIDQYWFFGWIALMVLATAIARPWDSSARRVIYLATAWVVSILAWGIFGGPYLGTQGLGLTLFFSIGVVIGGRGVLHWLTHMGPRTSFALGLAGLVAMITLTVSWVALPPTTEGPARVAGTVIAGVVASMAGVVGILLASRAISPVPYLSRFLAFCGEQSMAIFVAHVIFLAGVRTVLLKMGIYSVPIHVALGTLGAVVGCLALARIARRLGAGWLFTPPSWLLGRKRSDKEPTSI